MNEEIDKILEKLIEALNKLDDLYKETVGEMSKNLKAGLKGITIT